MNRRTMVSTMALSLALAGPVLAQAPSPADTPQAPSLYTS
jgi:hypothetical protein